MKKLMVLLAFAPVMAFAEVTVQCEQFPGKYFYNTNQAVLTIHSNEPIAIFIAQYREQDKVVYLAKGGAHVNKSIFPGVSAYGKYVIKSSDGGLQIVAYRCEAQR